MSMSTNPSNLNFQFKACKRQLEECPEDVIIATVISGLAKQETKI